MILPSKIIGVGLNYRDHAAGAEQAAARQAHALQQGAHLPAGAGRAHRAAGGSAPGGRRGRAGRGHRQGRARPSAATDAAEHIAGYTCFNDVSDREAQYADKQFFRGKSIDTGGPCGPWIVTPDELPDLGPRPAITCRWNGELMQDSNTDQLIFPVDDLIATPAAT